MAESEWAQMAVHVTAELSRLSEEVKKLDASLNAFKLEVARDLAGLKIKSGIWGLAGAAIPIAVMIALQLIHN